MRTSGASNFQYLCERILHEPRPRAEYERLAAAMKKRSLREQRCFSPDEVAELLRPEDALRREFGDDVYDSYLYAMGQGNRVMIASTLQDSPADVAGIRAGDTVLSYAGERVYSISDLQSATTSGEPATNTFVLDLNAYDDE